MMEEQATKPLGEITTFRYTHLHFDPATGVATFDYRADGADGTEFPFTDRVVFPMPPRKPDATTLAEVGRVLELLYVVVGIVYYKVLAARSISIDAVRLAPSAHDWAQSLYRSGMAEFAYLNDLPHILDIDVRADTVPAVRQHRDLSGYSGPPLVAFGGGKDSIVSVEALKAAGMSPVLFSMRRAPLLEEIMELSDCPTLVVDRQHDSSVPKLLRRGGHTGHVPVNATHTLTGIVLSLLHGLGPLILSNERSASADNLTWRGRSINHQWSKSIEGHMMLHQALRDHAGLTNATFSLLGGMSELHISQLFASTSAYDSKATSCNHAFRVFNRQFERWCTRCDKCRFVFLALAPFMGRKRLVGLIGANILDDDSHIDGYRELVGISGHKPLECVGEIIESRVAIRLLAAHPDWRDTSVVRTLQKELRGPNWPTDREVSTVFTAWTPRFVPDTYVEAIADMQRSCVPTLTS